VFGVFDSGLRVYGFVQDSQGLVCYFIFWLKDCTIGFWTFIGEFWNLIFMRVLELFKKLFIQKLPNGQWQCNFNSTTSFLLDFLFPQLD